MFAPQRWTGRQVRKVAQQVLTRIPGDVCQVVLAWVMGHFADLGQEAICIAVLLKSGCGWVGGGLVLLWCGPSGFGEDESHY